MKIFPTSAISEIDRYTIEHEPVPDIDLMERAASKLFDSIFDSEITGDVYIFCGPGNNGGDGLALARMLARYPGRFQPKVLLFDFGRNLSLNTSINLERLQKLTVVPVLCPSKLEEVPAFEKDVVLIDALLGSGLNRPLDGFAAEVVKLINHSGSKVISIDIPSGLMGENNGENKGEHIVHADITLTFQFPKVSFLYPENSQFVGEWRVLDIGLHPDAIDGVESPYRLIDVEACKERMKKREKFSHKGNYGHALLVAGAYGRMGAAVLAAKSCLRSGVGLLTAHVPHETYPILQTAVPEVMCDIDESDVMFTGVHNLEPYSAIGIGPALGQKVNTQKAIKNLLEQISVPLVADADAINILGLNPSWLDDLPKNTILTPHPREFERIAGVSNNSFQRMQKAIDMARKYRIIIVLKGAHTQVVCPDGNVWFNTTGNPGMATAGSGDVLTGIILGLLSQGYRPVDAAIFGVYLHGLAGDMALKKRGENSLVASDITECLGKAFKKIEKF